MGLVLDYDEVNHEAVVQSRNVFRVNDELEVFGPHLDDKSFVVKSIKNSDNEFIEVSNRPMDVVRIPLDFKVEAFDMIRRR